MEAPPPPDWDLLAVVRSCCTTTTTTSTADLHPPPPPPPPPPAATSASTSASSGALFHFPNPFEPPPITSTTSFLEDICKPLMVCTTTPTSSGTHNTNTTTTNINTVASSASTSTSTSSSFIHGGRTSFSVTERRIMKPSSSHSQQVVFGASPTGPSSSSQAQRTKKRKNLMKKVCHVPAEGLSSDMWAWRKYGQKPIKGSPYPRGYYRCSSSKGCLARKQVERNRSDPKMFIVTYTSEHNHPMPTHRNSLAGSTRQKTSTSAAGETSSGGGAAATPPDQPSCSSPSGDKSESKTECGEDLMKEENDEDNEMGLSELMLNDDYYVGFEQIDGEDGSDCFSDGFSPSMEFPWLANSSSSTATAAGGS